MLTVIATLNGTVTKYSSTLKSKGFAFVEPAKFKIIHGIAGMLAYGLAIAAIFLGINQSWIEFGDIYVKFGVLFALIVSGIYVTIKSFKLTVSRYVAYNK